MIAEKVNHGPALRRGYLLNPEQDRITAAALDRRQRDLREGEHVFTRRVARSVRRDRIIWAAMTRLAYSETTEFGRVAREMGRIERNVEALRLEVHAMAFRDGYEFGSTYPRKVA